MKTKEIRDLGIDELRSKEKALKKDLFNLNFQKRFGRVEKPGQFRILKKDIARIQTILKEREKDESRKSTT